MAQPKVYDIKEHCWKDAPDGIAKGLYVTFDEIARHVRPNERVRYVSLKCDGLSIIVERDSGR